MDQVPDALSALPTPLRLMQYVALAALAHVIVALVRRSVHSMISVTYEVEHKRDQAAITGKLPWRRT